MDVFFWPVLELMVWGFLSVYLEKMNMSGVSVVTILLGAIIFWDLLSQSQRAVSTSFLEDVWERNFLNIFITPLKVSEFLVSTVALGLVRIILVGVVMSVLAFLLYHFSILFFGFWLVLFAVNLLIFGWALGLFTTGIILRYGTAAQVLAFGFIFLIQPFSAVFYPVSALPQYLRYVSYIFPSTHVFEGMRALIYTGHFSVERLWWALGTNLVYITLTLLFFYRMFASLKKRGSMLKLD